MLYTSLSRTGNNPNINTHGRIDKQIVVYSYNGLSAIKRDKLLMHVATWMNLKNIRLNQKSQTQESTYCMTTFI